MTETFHIAGYCRISVDDELDKDNVSIENQKAILQDFVSHRFPGSSLTFYEDRDRSGYTFEQREGYQTMRQGLMAHRFDILLVKDFSRFSRRNSRGLVELEDLRDAGIRIISVGDGIDFPNDDDWLKIQFQFLINEIPVTDTSKKIRNVIKRRQADGKWICAAPYGYIINRQKQFEVVPVEADVVRKIFDLYNREGWGYKRIANYLTEAGIPTPRMAEQMRREAAGEACRRKVKHEWAIVTIQGILDNDFYIGTIRQGKFTRAKINGKDVRRDEDEQIVIENHHQAIIDYRTFATTRALREKRTRSNYRGVKINDNVYSGFLVCGDCGSPMFAMSRKDLVPAYTCGTYHKHGRSGCTSHHIRVDKLDEMIKLYLKKLLDSSQAMIQHLNNELREEPNDIAETEQSADHIAEVLDCLQEELKITKRQRIRDLMKHPDQEALLDETYDELEEELQKKIEGLTYQIQQLSDKRNTILRVNRAAKTALDVFHDLLEKDHLERNDLNLIVDRILVFEDHIDVILQSDVDTLLRTGALEESANFKKDIGDKLGCRLVQSASKRKDRVFDVHVISNGDPLEIYTDRDGEVIFRKYSLMRSISEFAQELCDSIHQTVGLPTLVTDRDVVLAVSGASKREFGDKSVSSSLEELMGNRSPYRSQDESSSLPIIEGNHALSVGAAAPILSQGDVLGCIIIGKPSPDTELTEKESLLAEALAGFWAGIWRGNAQGQFSGESCPCFWERIALFLHLCYS